VKQKERGKAVPSGKIMVTPPRPIYWLPAWLVSAGRNEGKWSRETSAAPPASSISWLPGRRSRRERTSKSGSLENKMRRLCDLDLLTSWPATGLGPEGMRKSGSVEKEDGDSPAPLTSWFPGRGSEPRGMSKSGSCKEMCRDHPSSLNWKVSRRARRAVGFARDRKVEGPAE
jgi:hypothetical protein